jgi:hypothetical protein
MIKRRFSHFSREFALSIDIGACVPFRSSAL